MYKLRIFDSNTLIKDLIYFDRTVQQFTIRKVKDRTFAPSRLYLKGVIQYHKIGKFIKNELFESKIIRFASDSNYFMEKCISRDFFSIKEDSVTIKNANSNMNFIKNINLLNDNDSNEKSDYNVITKNLDVYEHEFDLLLKDLTKNELTIIKAIILNNGISYKENVRSKFFNKIKTYYNSIVDNEIDANRFLKNLIYNYKYFFTLGINIIRLFIEINEYSMLEKIVLDEEYFNNFTLAEFCILNIFTSNYIKKHYNVVYNQFTNELAKRINTLVINFKTRTTLLKSFNKDTEVFSELIKGKPSEIVVIHSISALSRIIEFFIYGLNILSNHDICNIIDNISDFIYIKIGNKEVNFNDIYYQMVDSMINEIRHRNAIFKTKEFLDYFKNNTRYKNLIDIIYFKKELKTI